MRGYSIQYFKFLKSRTRAVAALHSNGALNLRKLFNQLKVYLTCPIPSLPRGSYPPKSFSLLRANV